MLALPAGECQRARGCGRGCQGGTGWFRSLRDRQARARINVRIRRLTLGNPGDVKPVGDGVSELRIDVGPGYLVYYLNRGEALIILLGGGDKSSQDQDIQAELEMARALKGMA